MSEEIKLPILMRCLKPGFPKGRRIHKDDFMPNGTVEIRQFCPAHTNSSAKDYPVEFYDKDGKEINGDFYREVHE